MAGIREIARQYRDEIMDGIAWVAIWKTGKRWNARAFWLDYDSDMIADEDMQEARDIVAADANAIFINKYYCAHMGDGKQEEIVSAIRFFYEEGWHKLADSTAYRAEEESKHKLTVESIINIYGSKVKEIKAYNEAKRTKVEEFLQVEPVAFALSDEPDVLRIYIDRESAEASLDGTLKENEAKKVELPRCNASGRDKEGAGMKELKAIGRQLKAMAEKEAQKIFRLARRAAAHGCRPETVEKIREEARWLHETATAYPDRLLRWQFEYEMKYAFKCEGYKE